MGSKHGNLHVAGAFMESMMPEFLSQSVLGLFGSLVQAEPEWYSNQQWNQWQQEAIGAPPGLAASKVGCFHFFLLSVPSLIGHFCDL